MDPSFPYGLGMLNGGSYYPTADEISARNRWGVDMSPEMGGQRDYMGGGSTRPSDPQANAMKTMQQIWLLAPEAWGQRPDIMSRLQSIMSGY